MHPELWKIPIFGGIPIKSYGFMLMIGFLSAIWFTARRTGRVKANPDIILNAGFVCLVAGVLGARLFYVVHYWETRFAITENPWLTVLKFTSGGLEFYGGLLMGMAALIGYLRLKRVSLRLYLDLIAPAAMWGLIFGRLGCFLNGCCWGGVCSTTNAGAHDAHVAASVPWAVRFPFDSPAVQRQWENRQITLPAELIVSSSVGGAWIKSSEYLKDVVEEGRKKPGVKIHVSLPEDDPRYAQRVLNAGQQYRSLPVHPTQLYAAVNALLLFLALSALLYRRQRHGVVIAALMILYPISRIVLEFVRVDNHADTAGLTISQAVSVGLLACGLVLLAVLYRLPLRSPRAVPYTMEMPSPAPKRK